jgi:O-antigen ligase
MPTGVSWNPNHTDITNHYLLYAVDGGLLALILFIAMLWTAFRYMKRMLADTMQPKRDRFLLWCLGAMLFGHTTTMITVSYFDQSVTFLYFNLAVIGSMYATFIIRKRTRAPEADPAPLVVSEPAV